MDDCGVGILSHRKILSHLHVEKSWDKYAFCLASYYPASPLSFWGEVDPPRSQRPLGKSILFPDAVHQVKFLLSLLCSFILTNLIKCYQWNKVTSKRWSWFRNSFYFHCWHGGIGLRDRKQQFLFVVSTCYMLCKVSI